MNDVLFWTHTLAIDDKQRRIWELLELFSEQIRSLAETSPAPDIIILALTPEIVDEAYAVQVTGNFYPNFRRAIKAKAMRWGLPIQLIQRSTILGKKGRGQKTPLQEKATRAWNFCTALYYKADGIPWCPVAVERDTCFIGIDFYVAQERGDTLTMRTSVAQAFDYLGQGFVLRGDPFEWNEDWEGRSPHMTQEGACRLISGTLREYVRVRGTLLRSGSSSTSLLAIGDVSTASTPNSMVLSRESRASFRAAILILSH